MSTVENLKPGYVVVKKQILENVCGINVLELVEKYAQKTVHSEAIVNPELEIYGGPSADLPEDVKLMLGMEMTSSDFISIWGERHVDGRPEIVAEVEFQLEEGVWVPEENDGIKAVLGDVKDRVAQLKDFIRLVTN